MKQLTSPFDYCTMLSADAGKIFTCKLSKEQVYVDDSAKSKGSDTEDQLDKDDGGLSTQTVHEVNEMDIYDIPEPRLSNEQPSKSSHQDAENIPQTPLVLPKNSLLHMMWGKMVMLLPREPKPAQ